MKPLYNTLILVFLSTALLFANDKEFKGRYTKEKTVKKEFQVNPEALLAIHNSYGNLNLTSWNENRTVIEVHIKTNGNNEEKVTERLNEIKIEFDANSNQVIAHTIFNDKKWKWNRKNNVSVEVNYIIKLPVTNKVNLNNDYGGIYINKLNNTAIINCDYGKLDIGELWGSNNELNFDYTSNSKIGVFKHGKINADYSDFTIEKTNQLTLNADYNNTTIMQAGTLRYNADYGNLTVGTVDKLEGNGDYITVKVDKVNDYLLIQSDYGSIDVNELSNSFKKVTIDAEYTGVKLGYNSDCTFTFDIALEYAGLDGKNNLEFSLQDNDNTDHRYKGYYTTKNTTNHINITSAYGGVKLIKK